MTSCILRRRALRFSRARDRSLRTRLRATQRPQGLPGKVAECRSANLIVRNVARVVKWAADELDAIISIENPASSYLWIFWEKLPQADTVHTDVTFDNCHTRRPRLLSATTGPQIN